MTDLEASEAEKAALETRISLLKRERRRLEAEFTRSTSWRRRAKHRCQQASCNSHRWWRQHRRRRRPMQGHIMARGYFSTPTQVEQARPGRLDAESAAADAPVIAKGQQEEEGRRCQMPVVTKK